MEVAIGSGRNAIRVYDPSGSLLTGYVNDMLVFALSIRGATINFTQPFETVSNHRESTPCVIACNTIVIDNPNIVEKISADDIGLQAIGFLASTQRLANPMETVNNADVYFSRFYNHNGDPIREHLCSMPYASYTLRHVEKDGQKKSNDIYETKWVNILEHSIVILHVIINTAMEYKVMTLIREFRYPLHVRLNAEHTVMFDNPQTLDPIREPLFLAPRGPSKSLLFRATVATGDVKEIPHEFVMFWPNASGSYIYAEMLAPVVTVGTYAIANCGATDDGSVPQLTGKEIAECTSDVQVVLHSQFSLRDLKDCDDETIHKDALSLMARMCKKFKLQSIGIM